MDNQTEYTPGLLRIEADEAAAIIREIDKSVEKLLILAENLMKEYRVQECEQILRDLRNSADTALSGYSIQIRHLYMAAEFYEKSAGIILSEAEQIVKGAGLQIQ